MESNVRYTGRVKSVPDGYGFIALTTVQKKDGSAHGLETRHDLFVHKDDCGEGVTLVEGVLLEFAVHPDAKRGEGCFRAVAVTAAEESTMPRTGPVMPGFALVPVESGLVIPSGHPDRYAIMMKPVPPATVAQAALNEPLRGVPRDDEEIQIPDDETGLLEAIEAYLYGQYPGLASIDVSFAVRGFDGAAQDAQVEAEAKGNEQLGMVMQAGYIREEYQRFKATRELLGWILDRGFLRPGTAFSPAILTTLIRLVEGKQGSAEKGQVTKAIGEAVEYMMGHDLLRPNTVLPIANLVDLALAVPVWYFVMNEEERQSAARGRASDGIVPHWFVKQVCECLGTSRAATLFQLFNVRGRDLSGYRGEIIPPHVREILTEARNAFDVVAVATPHHDQAGRDWGELPWPRAVDPYVIGIKRGLPVLFVLGRFSDTGVYPRLHELVADTIEFCRANSHRVTKFNQPRLVQWHDGKQVVKIREFQEAPRSGNAELILNKSSIDVAAMLTKFMQDLIAAFEAGHCFDWLRETWNLPEPTKATDPAKR